MWLDKILQFIGELDGWDWLYYFWPFFLFDFTRYTLLAWGTIWLWIPRHPREGRRLLFKARPLVSVIVPGKNEGRHLTKLITSLKRQTYKRIELVVVDDGSDDMTPQLGRRLEREGKIDRFIRNRIRGGKASAANTALRFCHGEYVVHLDADSYLRYDAIERLIIPFFQGKDVGAVGGDIRVANLDVGFATRLQGAEYLKGLTLGRTVAASLGILRIVAGAYGAFRKDILDRLGGWDVGPGLDGDIVLKIRKLGCHITHEPQAICYTNVPETFQKLAKQRYRWDRSLIRFRLRKHRDLLVPHTNIYPTNFITAADNVFMVFLLNAKWWGYLIYMLTFHASVLPILLALNYFFYFCANVIQFALVNLVFKATLRRQEIGLWAFLPLMPLYIGVYLRLVRTFAHCMELFHKASYRDTWNPWKVSSVVKRLRT